MWSMINYYLVLDGIPELRLVHQPVHDINISPLRLECSKHPEGENEIRWWCLESLTCPR